MKLILDAGNGRQVDTTPQITKRIYMIKDVQYW